MANLTKQKEKVHLLFKQVENERDCLVDNVNRLVLELQKLMTSMENYKSVKELQELFSLELKVVTKFSEVNFDLLNFFEENPLISKLSDDVEVKIESEIKNEVNYCKKDSNYNSSEDARGIVVKKEESDENSKAKLNINSLSLSNVENYFQKPSCELFQGKEDVFLNNLKCADTEVDLSEVSSYPESSSTSTSFECKGTIIDKINNLKKNNIEIQGKPKLPDISLNPSQVLKLGNKIKKKKIKKNQFFELKEPEVPQVGDLCIFAHIESPNSFYLNIIDGTSAKIDEISDKLNQTLKERTNDYSNKREAEANIKKFCFVYVTEYSNWYRAEIQDWFLDKKNDEVLLKLVDFGNQIIVKYKYLKPLNLEMSLIPKLALKCNFPLLYPPGSTHSNKLKDWPQSTIDTLQELTEIPNSYQSDKIQNVFRIDFAAKLTDDSVSVDLINVDEKNQELTLGQKLIDLGLAVQIEEEHLELDEFLDDLKDLEKAENINEAITGYDAKDESRICKFSQPDGTCFKGTSCKLEHSTLNTDRITTDKGDSLTGFINIPIVPIKGEIFEVLITEYINSCSFYATRIKDPITQEGYRIDRELYKLLKQMNNPKVVSTYVPFKLWPAIGEIVIVKHCTGRWVRGIIQHLQIGKDWVPTKAQVFVLDFGDVLNSPLENIRQMKVDFLQLPCQALRIDLYKLVESPDVNVNESREFFENNIRFRNFTVEVKNVGRSSSIPLQLEVFSLNEVDLGEELLKRGFAIPGSLILKAADSNGVPP